MLASAFDPLRRASALAILGAALMVGSLSFVTLPARAADDLPVVRLGVLKFGTVNWELTSMQHHGLDTANGFTLEIVPFAGGDATEIALQGGAVEVIVSDWLWVSRLRSEGTPLAFVPYSSSVGAIMVAGDADIASVADLRGKKIGVAGGPLDKSWLLLQGHARRSFGLDLAAENDIVFGAPPLLAEKARSGELDAVLNYWHYNARLEADGFRRLVSAEDAANALGASGPVSSIGYVFDEGWARDAPIEGFIEASRQTKQLLADSDEEWQRLADSGAIKDGPEALLVLRDRFREGIPSRPLGDEIADTAIVYGVLAELGGEKLVGQARSMAPGTYWGGAGSGL